MKPRLSLEPAPTAAMGAVPGSRTSAAPVVLTCRERAQDFEVVSADPFCGVLQTPAGRRTPPIGARLTLSGHDAGLGDVVFVAVVTGLGADVGAGGSSPVRRLTVEWAEVAASGRRQTLIDALHRVLGLRARRTSAEDSLSRQRVLVYDAVARQVRLTTLAERPDLALALAPELPSAPGRRQSLPGGRPRTQPRILVDTGRPVVAQPHVSPLVVTLGRTEPRPMPVYRRTAAAGTYSLGDRTTPMEVTLLGLTHCMFVMQGVDAPPVGAHVELAVPADPVAMGHVLVSGQVSLVTADAYHGRAFVEVDLQSRQLPPLYHRLVMHWGRRG